ncbi:MAG TPA: putative peptidoglycan glycosyltransferase FtsW [Caldisericia bacterium]|nr:cell division protein FtsW [Caldisericia bacterium]HOR47090.1 putative peptidoglycan glycosyltransferase FtsW [Caldisericia bacterium]HOU08023.1 putative peptidoglycan glycosyltransferase FtsW [Caldisericia bacterium]HQG59578.1 putative peptidoglycan glycosyltransferase FtsW [Caldisericia bacterium]HQH49201.1 putative peptidoglycan glycosyltransferase FtsW [Caldisericia bacterium]
MPKRAYVFDKGLLFSTLSLVGIGLLAVYSAGVGKAFVGEVPSPGYLFFKQLVAFIIGFTAGFVAYRSSIDTIKLLAYPIYFLAIGLLVLLYVPGFGVTINYSTRWIEIAGQSFQPSELAKVGLILSTASYLSAREPRKMSVKEVFKLFLMFGVPALLVLRSPDLGSTIVILTIFITQYFLSGAPMWGLIFLGALFVLGVLYESLTRVAYWKDRITAWLDPLNPNLSDNVSYQMVQSLIAIANGGFFGSGLFYGQQKFGRLPMVESDFVFSLVVEELGFVGAVFVIAMFALFVVRAIRIASRSKNLFSYLVALGIGLHIGLQGFINMAVATGLLPVTGVTLPFLSAGGTSLIVNMIEVGILFAIDRNNRQELT